MIATASGDHSALRLDMLRRMMLIRAFEQSLIARRDHGFQLLSSGQEATSVGVCAALSPQDQVLSGGRSIAPALARSVDPRDLLAELLGRVTGPCRGKGGRGHFAQISKGFFGAHAVVGGNLTVAAGVALAAQQAGEDKIVVCFFGDGACGSGALHETMNLASIWKLPLLLVCDNNQYSIATRAKDTLAPHALAELARPFGIASVTLDGMDADAVYETARRFVESIRSGAGPGFLECVSHRFATHSSATRETRKAQELADGQAQCPIAGLSRRLVSEGVLTLDALAELNASITASLQAAHEYVDASPMPDPSEALKDVA